MQVHVHGGCVTGDAVALSDTDGDGRRHLGILLPGLDTPCFHASRAEGRLSGLVFWCPADDTGALDRLERALRSALDCLPGPWTRNPQG